VLLVLLDLKVQLVQVLLVQKAELAQQVLLALLAQQVLEVLLVY
jgi:hypothetical protein